MNDKRRHNISEQLKHDKEQTILTEYGIAQNDNTMAKRIFKYRDQNVYCPFCLCREQINKFLVSTKNGFSRKLGECPECHNGLLLETLIRMLEFTPIEYADFVYNYPRALFWQKANATFDKWRKRLYNLNMSNDFWEEYKRLKEENYQKGYGDDN